MDTDHHIEDTGLQIDTNIYSLTGECLYESTFTESDTDDNERVETVVDLTDDSVETEKTSQDTAIEITKNVQRITDRNKIKVTDLQSNKMCSVGSEFIGEPNKAIEKVGVVIDLTQTSIDSKEASKDVAKRNNSEDIDAHKVTGIQNNKMCYEIENEFSKNPCKVENNETTTEFIDFEELIDITRVYIDTDKNIPDIQEFENILNSFPLSGTSNTNDNEIFNLDEVNEFFNSLVTESSSSSLHLETLPIVQSNIETTVKTEHNLDINTIKTDTVEEIQLEGQSNDAGSDLKITTAGVKVDNKDNEYLITSIEETETDSDGYNSSDFEFINENEAKMDGLITNITKNDSYDKNNVTNNKIKHNYYNYDNKIEYYDIDDNNSQIYDPGEGPSGINGAIEDYGNRGYRENHHIPDEEGYLNLFQGPYGLPMSDIIFLENKSVRPSPMNLQYEGIGFVNQIIRRQHQPDSSDEEYADEAKDSIEKILFMYPDENRKPKRRRF